MKTFFVILTFCLTGVLAELTPEEKAKMEEALVEACIKETGVDPDHLTGIENTAEKNEKLGCFLACTMKRTGTMNADGTINEEAFGVKTRIPSSIPKDKATEILNKCKVMKGNNACQTAMEIRTCIHKETNI